MCATASAVFSWAVGRHGASSCSGGTRSEPLFDPPAEIAAVIRYDSASKCEFLHCCSSCDWMLQRDAGQLHLAVAAGAAGRAPPLSMKQ